MVPSSVDARWFINISVEYGIRLKFSIKSKSLSIFENSLF